MDGSNSLHCPRCGAELLRDSYLKKICFRCPEDHGVALTVSAVRALCRGVKFADLLWRKAYNTSEAHGGPCPICRRPMKVVSLPAADGAELELDICCRCQEVWFDPDELEALPLPQAEEELPQRAREILALHEVRRIERESAAADTAAAPENKLLLLAACLGFPAELDAPAHERRPVITWILAALCIVCFFPVCLAPEETIGAWGLVPARLWRMGGATLLSSMFLHGGVWHLVGNMYFLLTFGDNVEDALGRTKYLLLVLLSGLTASATHILFNLDSQVPCVGASGFISGIIAAYAVLYPQVTLAMLMRFGWLFRFIRLPAWAAFCLWLVYQCVMAALTGNGPGSGVAYTAHLGGATFGLIFGLAMRAASKRAVEEFDRDCRIQNGDGG